MINRSALARMVTTLINEMPASDSPFSEQLALEYGGVLVVIRPTAGHMVARPHEAQPKGMMRLPKAKPSPKKAPRPKRPSELKAAAEKQQPKQATANGAKTDKPKADKAQPVAQ